MVQMLAFDTEGPEFTVNEIAMKAFACTQCLWVTSCIVLVSGILDIEIPVTSMLQN